MPVRDIVGPDHMEMMWGIIMSTAETGGAGKGGEEGFEMPNPWVLPSEYSFFFPIFFLWLSVFVVWC